MIFYLSSLSWVISVRLLILICGIAFVSWLYSVVRSQLSSKNHTPLVEIQLRAMIEGLFVSLVLFAGYLFFFIEKNGWPSFTLNTWTWDMTNNIYYLLLPEIVSFACLTVAFFWLTNKLSNLYK